MVNREYDDDYLGCARTYVGFTVRHWTASSEDVTATLGVEPTDLTAARRREEQPGIALAARPNSWHFSTATLSESRDFGRHLDILLETIGDKSDELSALRSRGWAMDISVYWLSRHGHGGPALWPDQSASLGQLGLEIWFDIYFDDSEDLDRPLGPGELTQNFRRAARHWRKFGLRRGR